MSCSESLLGFHFFLDMAVYATLGWFIGDAIFRWGHPK